MEQLIQKNIRVVYLEDDLRAFELVQELVTSEGMNLCFEHVEGPDDFRKALAPTPPDLILSDFNLPLIDGLSALAIKNELCRDTPFIFVSGRIGEETAIASLRDGATDFILKDSLNRLPAAILRALKEGEVRKQRLLAEQRLKESEERYRRLTENAPDIIFRFSFEPVPKYDYISPAVERISGYTPEEFYTVPGLTYKMVHPDDLSFLEQLVKTRQLPEGQKEIRWFSKDGKEIVTEQRYVPVYDTHGALVAIEGIARDITVWKHERDTKRELEAQLFHAQKMETIGTLAGGIAHDFNNILTGILGFNELATITLPPNHPLQEDLGEVRKAGLRAKDLVAQILSFSRKKETKAAPIDLAKTVEEALRLVRASTPKTIQIINDLKPGIVRADSTQIHQVILNLCTNSAHAMHGTTGKLKISIQPCAFTNTEQLDVGQLNAGNYLCLSVADTGHGMTDEVLKQVFAPFFTTKRVGEGTGIGLALVKNIVNSLNGAIRLRSAPNQGTTFDIFLPACSESEKVCEPSNAIHIGQGQRIVVVDDETSIGTFAAARLEQLKYRVTVFSDSRAALTSIIGSPTRFDALLTDYSMPNLTGLDLIKRLRAAGIAIPAILSSGNNSNEPPSGVSALGRVRLLQKPFSGDDLAIALSALLEKPAQNVKE